MVKIILGKNDLASLFPELIEEWDYSKNDELGIRPNEVTKSSFKKVWWIGKCGHNWDSVICSRTKGVGCPICSNLRVLEGYNDLATTNPELLREWDYKKNKELGLYPNEVVAGTNTRAWWKCDKGHEWESKIRNRIRRGCPYCDGRYAINGETDLATTNPELIEEWDYERNKELGIFPENVKLGSKVRVWWKCLKGHSWNAHISNRRNGVGCPVCANKIVLKGYNDLLSKFPDLCKEWDYEKNDINPDCILFGTSKKVWWKCKYNHNYNMTVVSRTSRGTGCPYCAGRYAIIGENDLATTNPELKEEWFYEKNIAMGIQPENVKAGSNIKVWWKCSKQHEYMARIAEKTKGRGCPFCSGKRVLVGFNDIATTVPNLLSEWNYEKNQIKPTEITQGSDKRIWWKCSKGHEWQSTINNRKNCGCPICSRETHTSFPEQAIMFYFKKFFPDAINGDRFVIKPLELDIYIPSINVGIEYDGQAWHSKNNKDNKKNRVCKEKGIKLYRIREYKCAKLDDDYAKCYYYDGKDYEQLSRIIEKILSELNQRDINVDIIADRQNIYDLYVLTVKENSLLVKYPELAKEWNYEKNGTLIPERFSYASEKKVWWKCKEGHEWEAMIGNRIKGRACCKLQH